MNFGDTGNFDLLIDKLQKRVQIKDKVKVKWPQCMAFIVSVWSLFHVKVGGTSCC